MERRLSIDSRAQTRRAGLSFFTAISIEDWLAIGDELVSVSDASAWWLGDWLVYGEQRFPERYRMAIDSTNLSYKTLRNYAWVARRFPVARRRDALGLAHHAEVAALPEGDQEYWLDRTVARSWSVAELRRRLKTVRAGAALPSGEDRVVERVEITVDAERKRRWQDAADSISCDLAEWACGVIDKAADAEPSGSARAAVAG
ncbi:MAG: LmbU family transcriptional regulator [Actinoallomurus sp.]